MKKILIVIIVAALFYIVTFELIPRYEKLTFAKNIRTEKTTLPKNEVLPAPTVEHREAPYPLHGIYFSSWAAGSETYRKRMNDLINTAAINAVVIDIKDATGKMAYIPKSPELLAVGSGEDRIPDLDSFIQTLHQKGIYVIGRVAVFQDNYLPRKKPSLALIQAGTSKIWVDKNNLGWLDPSSEEVWKYTLQIADESYARGFDEINFDYIRFPSDGGTKKYERQFSPTISLQDALTGFFNYLDTHVNKRYPVSFDVFGMTTTASDDMGIGQWLENIIAHGNYTMPMVYPSHYSAGNFGFQKPAEHPYEVVFAAMHAAALRAEAIGLPRTKLRSWLQDFDLGAIYDKTKVEAQIKASVDAGVLSWVLWDASNQYTKEALLDIAQSEKSDPQGNGDVQ